MNRFVIACLASLAALAASCAPRPQPPQPTAPPPTPPAPPPTTPPPPPPADWRDAPLSPGDWTYSAGTAVFMNVGAPVLTVRCDAAGRLSLIRGGASGGSRITIRTSFGDRSLTAMPAGPGLAATIAASDPLLDQIAYSRGRFLVESDGAPVLIVPAWPEPARVVEDCRT